MIFILLILPLVLVAAKLYSCACIKQRVLNFILLSAVTVCFSACKKGSLTETDLLALRYVTFKTEVMQTKGLTDLEKAEGIATLNSIYSFVKEVSHAGDDFYNPVVLEWITPERKFAGDNPDAQYFSFFIDPEADYSVKLSHQNVFFMEVTSYKRVGNQNAISASYIVKPGENEIILSSSEKTSAQVKLNSEDYIVMIRYYKTNGKLQSPKPLIACLDRPYPGRKQDASFRSDLAVSLFDALYKSSDLLTKQMESEVNGYVEELDMDNPYIRNLYPTKSNIYNGAFICVPKGKYLSVKGRIDSSKYVVFVFYNRWWATPFNGADRVSLNNSQIETDEAGNYEINVSSEMCDLPNLIVTNGLENGILSIRSLFEEAEEPVLELKSF